MESKVFSKSASSPNLIRKASYTMVGDEAHSNTAFKNKSKSVHTYGYI